MCTNEVRALLQKLQDAYARRDLSLVEQTMGLFSERFRRMLWAPMHWAPVKANGVRIAR